MNIDTLINNATKKQKVHKNMYDSNLNILQINGSKHLNNYLNYLCRTDADQKWTDPSTFHNLYIVCDRNDKNKFKQTLAINSRQREVIKNYIADTIRIKAKEKQMKYNEFVDKLLQTRLDYLDENVYEITETVKSDTLDVIKDLYKTTPGFEMICAVVHEDQHNNYVHLHILFYLNNTTKRS